MSDFNKTALLTKTGEYMDYITLHRINVRKAWGELQKALAGTGLTDRYEIADRMECRVNCHDDSKMSEEEFLPYRQHFYPVDGEIADEEAFQRAWEHHYRCNDHHWEYWIGDDGNFFSTYRVEDKICACLEMICDWQAMGYVFGNAAPVWYQQHKSEIKIDPNWVDFVEGVLDALSDYLSLGEN